VIVRRLAVLALMAVAIAACATTAPVAPVVPVAVAPAPDPLVPSQRQALVSTYNERAQALEVDGRLREAFEARKIALTVDPDNAVARVGQGALQAKIDGLISQRLAEGRAAQARGAQVAARRSFLTVLALDPENRAAFEALREQTPDVEGLPHIVRTGETLTGLAQQYYGNRALGEVIAEANRLGPNARLAAGTQLKIPEVPGVPLSRPGGPGARREAPRAPLPGPGAPPATPASVTRDEPAEVNPLLVEARESFERKDYATALGDVDRLLASTPSNAEALAIKRSALYGLGKTQYDQRQYKDSYVTLGQLVKLAPKHEDAVKLLRQSRVRLIDDHFGRGIRYYREEKLPEAIVEWKAVLELDPQHIAARKNLEQSERLLKSLEERK
jgi:tetratricopeptide (TPR) repeat protein